MLVESGTTRSGAEEGIPRGITCIHGAPLHSPSSIGGASPAANRDAEADVVWEMEEESRREEKDRATSWGVVQW